MRSMNTRNIYVLLAISSRIRLAWKGIFNSDIYDGYEINLNGQGYVDDKQEKFWQFLIPYCITTLVAIIALFVAA